MDVDLLLLLFLEQKVSYFLIVGINMGTRFMCTKEAPIHQNVKQAIVDGTEKDTALMFRTLGNTARVFKNKVHDLRRDKL